MSGGGKVILAFDLARRTGVAVDSGTPGVPQCWTVKLPGTDEGEYGRGYVALAQLVRGLVSLHKPYLIAIEAPMGYGGRGGHNSQAATELQFGRAAIVEMIGSELDVTCERAAVATVRKAFLGTGRPEFPKRAVMERCRVLGWKVDDDNSADAAALWSYTKSFYEPSVASRSTPLFAEARAP